MVREGVAEGGSTLLPTGPGPKLQVTVDPSTLLDHYRVLQVPRHADRATLRRAFLRLCKQHHPDTTTLPAAVASERFRRIKAAYTTLQDPAARQRHDAWLRQHYPPAVEPVAVHATEERPVSPERPLSGGEWLALMLLLGALLFCAALAGILFLQQS